MPEADRVMIVEVVQKIAERLNPQPEEDYGFMDNMRCITACLPWTTLRVPHRAYLRPQAPQSPTIFFDFLYRRKSPRRRCIKAKIL